MDIEKMYDVYEACEILHLVPQTVYKNIKLGRIRAYKTGLKILIPQSEIEYILACGYHKPGESDYIIKKFRLNGKTYIYKKRLEDMEQ